MAVDRFRDVYLPSCIMSYDAEVMPYWSTGLVVVDNGDEKANKRWTHPLRRINLPEAIRDWEKVAELRDHWLIMAGPAFLWPFQDPTDFSSTSLVSAGVTDTLAFDDQLIGVGDGITQTFQLQKTYTQGGYTYVRDIKLPVTSTVLVGVNGVAVPTGWSVSRYGGVITFDTAPDPGHSITAGFLFDLLVRYESDDTFGQVVNSYRTNGFSDLTLIERRFC